MRIKPSQMPKMQPLPVSKRGERRRWLILEDWTFDLLGAYQIYVIKKGFIFDGASIPRLFWNLLSPTGYLFLAGLIHDWIYKFAFVWTRSVNAKGKPGRLYKMPLSKEEADRIFQDVADSIAMGEKCWTGIAKKTLDWFGHTAWDEHREREAA